MQIKLFVWEYGMLLRLSVNENTGQKNWYAVGAAVPLYATGAMESANGSVNLACYWGYKSCFSSVLVLKIWYASWVVEFGIKLLGLYIGGNSLIVSFSSF